MDVMYEIALGQKLYCKWCYEAGFQWYEKTNLSRKYSSWFDSGLSNSSQRRNFFSLAIGPFKSCWCTVNLRALANSHRLLLNSSYSNFRVCQLQASPMHRHYWHTIKQQTTEQPLYASALLGHKANTSMKPAVIFSWIINHHSLKIWCNGSTTFIIIKVAL